MKGERRRGREVESGVGEAVEGCGEDREGERKGGRHVWREREGE